LVIGFILALIGSLFVLQPALFAQTNDELVISVWGGTTEKFFREVVEPEFKKLYPDVTITYDIGGSTARYSKLLAQKENPTIDIYVSPPEQLFAAIDNDLLVPIDRTNVPNMESLYDWGVFAPEYGAAYGCIAYGIGYNPDFFGDNPPTSWNDLWRPEVQGKNVIPAVGHSQMVAFVTEIAELNGGSREDIQPALERMAELQPGKQFVFFTDYVAEWNAGDLVIVADFDYYLYDMASQGSKVAFVIPEEGAIGAPQHISIVKGTEDQKMAEDFMNLMFSPDMQTKVATILLNSPAREDTPIPPELADQLTCSGLNKDQVKYPDHRFAVSVRPQWTERLEDEVLPNWP
jgi:putative spermidine/putrescine transport system substrate-binding protein